MTEFFVISFESMYNAHSLLIESFETVCYNLQEMSNQIQPTDMLFDNIYVFIQINLFEVF